MLINALLYSLNTWMKKAVKPSSTTIGDTRIINGTEYWNVGNLDNQDNWCAVGPAEPRYFINVMLENNQVSYTLAQEENPYAIYIEGFYEKEFALKKLRMYGYYFKEEEI
ncbi:hypothetical protein AJGP001_03645 [Planococcus faecalis]|uniref:Uncharacterized protein n=2 Tax=Planococcus faecalis TaxID=1598147 RepID=A0ABM6IPH1_9BACL|nr:hypothetical protein [Planococcus faecalis]AQU78445.1 hypothetical protein AJGP001_03645 [Planococcus faecalis]OHX52364.1 hypothetical protein BB777_11970 [Planococcus faecalis]